MLNPQFCNFASVLILAFLSTLACTRADDLPNPNKSTEYKLCTSQICDEAGNEIIRSLNESVNPCDDFYQHACGNWTGYILKPAVLTDPKSQSHVIGLKSLLETRNLLEEMVEKNETENETLRKIKDFYRSCKNTTAILAEGLSALKPMVSANGGWPLAMPPSSWSLEGQNLTLQKLHENYVKEASSSAFFLIQVIPDQLDASVNLLNWRQPYSDYGFSSLSYAEILAEKFAELQGFNVSSDDIKADVEEMFIFRAALDEFYGPIPKAEYDSGSYYRVATIAEVQDEWNAAVAGRPDLAFDWLEIIRGEIEGTGIVINATEKIELSRRRIVEQLADLLKNTSLRTVVNFIHWQAIVSLVSYTEPYENSDEERSFFCINHHMMGEGLFYAYVRKYFNDNSSLTPISDMVSQIKVGMKGLFDQSTWMDDEAKLKSKEKVDGMLNNLGYPRWYEEPGKIDEYYSRLEIGTSYIENVKNCRRLHRTEWMKKLREPFDRYKAEWPVRDLRIRAYYAQNLNTITVPAMYFQMPFFNAERPLVMNYGSLGVLIGREASHAFDKTGITFDKDGNNKQWLSNSTIARYNEKAKCLVDQYSNYTISDKWWQTIRISGEETSGENIADHTGIKIALKAYLAYKKEHNPEDIRISAFKDYTDEKLFFYSLSNSFCTVRRVDDLGRYLNYRIIPSTIRLNAVLLNMPEFSEAFNCPSGSPMNPEKKCNLWD